MGGSKPDVWFEREILPDLVESVATYDPFLDLAELPPGITRCETIEDLLGRADVVSIHIPLIEKDPRGISRCTGADTVDRMGLALATAAAFDLDSSLITSGPSDFSETGPAPVPIDTSLNARATGEALDYELPDLDHLLAIFRHEVDHRELAPR